MSTKSGLYRYSYSGADANCYAFFEGAQHEICKIESVHTISYSVHEAKGDARAFGFRGIKGMARGMRTIAGSLILTVVEDHPLRPLMNIVGRYPRLLRGSGWSVDQNEIGVGSWSQADTVFNFSNRLAPLLPPSNWLVNFVSESARVKEESSTDLNYWKTTISGAALLIRGVEFIDEGQVTSVNDMVTEVTYSFKAWDVKPISPIDLIKLDPTDATQRNLIQSRAAQEQFRLQEELFKKQTDAERDSRLDSVLSDLLKR